MTDKLILFEGTNYTLKLGHYLNGRIMIMAINADNKNDSFNVTVDLSNVPVKEDTILFKTYHRNVGLFKILYTLGVLEAPTAAYSIGFNYCFECTLHKEYLKAKGEIPQSPLDVS